MKKVTLNLLIIFVAAALFSACNNPTTNTTNVMASSSSMDSITKSYKEKTQAVYDAIQSGDLSKLGDEIDSNVIEHGGMFPNGSASGIAVSRKIMTQLKTSFPDLKFEMTSFVADSEMAFAHYRFTGTNTGPTMDGKPATNKKVDFTGVDVIKIKNGKAVEHWGYEDDMTMMNQMGNMPPPPADGKMEDKMKAK